jgi:hypothetical protein
MQTDAPILVMIPTNSCNDNLASEIVQKAVRMGVDSDDGDKESVCSFYSCVQDLERSEEEDGCIVKERGSTYVHGPRWNWFLSEGV